MDERRRRRASAWYKLNVAAAITVGLYIVGFHDGWYESLASTRPVFGLVLVGLIGAVPLIKYLRASGSEVLAVWAILATIFLGIAAFRAGDDAYFHNHSNCWTIRESGDADEPGGLVEIIECVPGKGEPVQGSWFDNEIGEGESRSCEQTDTSSSGGTIWRCVRENF